MHDQTLITNGGHQGETVITQADSKPRQHVVHFYEDDQELTATVGAHLAEGVEAEDAVLMVATAEHRRLFSEKLAAAGLDVEAARASGRLAELSASETLAQLMADGSPQPEAFEALIGGAIQRSRSEGRPVRAYGEMVPLLWDAGEVTAALELEELWNGLMERQPFSLFCAYPSATLAGDAHVDARVDICRRHSAVVSPRSATPTADAVARFPATSQALGSARRFVAQTLHAWRRADLADDATLVVSELATNALNHARSGFEVVLTRLETGMRLSVSDTSSLQPVRRSRTGFEPGGRGLAIIHALAARWGSHLTDGGKLVWVELADQTSLP